MSLFNKFTETVFLKEDSELENKVNKLRELSVKYPNNKDISNQLKIAEYGLKGEKEIEFCLKNANVGMYVLHDINLEYEDLKAQIDYIVITPVKCYLIECKNMIGEITIDSNGQFIRKYNGKKEAIESPLRQSERHREVLLKIVNNNKANIIYELLFSEKSFNNYYVPIVVFSNNSAIMHNRYAPKEIKDRIIRSDELVSYIKNDVQQVQLIDRDGKKRMKDLAEAFKARNVSKEVNYEDMFYLNDSVCPNCGGELIKRTGKYGEFYGCRNFPKCKYTKKEI
ncbi:MAG: NERD domain-containing protein [Bacilli bacterium]|nr:NERD domain-containing protein [Bacilli bacterium]